MEIRHFTAGARGTLPLCRDDEDRFDLLERILEPAPGLVLLTYCLMRTHVHVVAACRAATGVAWLERVLAAYARSFNRRVAEPPLLRGPVVAQPAVEGFELGRLVQYVHRNPLDTRPPVVGEAVEFPWSGARAFAGLSLEAGLDTGFAREALGRHAGWALPHAWPLARLEPARDPCVRPEKLLSAAAQVYGLRPRLLAGTGRVPALVAARAVFMRLGELESYGMRQLAPYLGRSLSQAYRAAEVAVPDRAVRIARTLVATPAFRRQLPTVRCEDSSHLGALR